MSKVFDYYCPDGFDDFCNRNIFEEQEECELCGKDFKAGGCETVCPVCRDFTNHEDYYIKRRAS